VRAVRAEPLTAELPPVRGRPRATWILFITLLATGAALRFWNLAGKPDWTFDENVYANVAANVLHHGTLNEHIVAGQQWYPFLYQPPFYFLVLARWFAVVGPGITHARTLGVIFALAMLSLLFRLLRKIHDQRTALLTMVPVVLDGWLIYVERASYMENGLALIVVAGLLFYQRALERPSWQRYAAAGGVLGFAPVFKLTGVYVILAALLCWLILRRDHIGHLVLLGTAALEVTIYAVTMTEFFDIPGHAWFIQQTEVQVRRVLGLQRSAGTVSTPGQVYHLITHQYGVFIPSAIIATCGLSVLLRRLWQCYRTRNWAPAQSNALLFSWTAAAFIVFAASALKFPQYFSLVLIPLYCFWWTEFTRWDRRKLLLAIPAAAVAGVISFTLVGTGDNPFHQAQIYAATSIPRSALVVTEEPIGDDIGQPWCRIEQADLCPYQPQYAITWNTYLQSSLKEGGPLFQHMMAGATALRSFRGFSGTATVWRLR
jgi:4-amino-4-deoxy-L-arabinose transferase-like glycosyltransferase